MTTLTFVVISMLFIVLPSLHISLNKQYNSVLPAVKLSMKGICVYSFAVSLKHYVDESHSIIVVLLSDMTVSRVTVVHSFSLQECCTFIRIL